MLKIRINFDVLHTIHTLEQHFKNQGKEIIIICDILCLYAKKNELQFNHDLTKQKKTKQN